MAPHPLAWLRDLAFALVVRATRESLIAHPLNKETSAVRVVLVGIRMSLQLTTKSIKMSPYGQLHNADYYWNYIILLSL
jgi:hypothetical protein